MQSTKYTNKFIIMKKSLLILCLSVLGSSAMAQDIIVKTNADEIQAKVVKVTDSSIEYKKWHHLNGPSYEIAAKDVFIIQYQNGKREVISTDDISISTIGSYNQHSDAYPRYQGDVAVGYAVSVGEFSDYMNLDRVILETVHGVRINPYLFTGLGTGVNYFYSDKYFTEDYGLVVPAFLNLKGYYPISSNFSAYLTWDIGAAIGVAGYTDGSDFYTAIGPGVNFGGNGGGLRGDFSIRFQHMGEGFNAIMFRIGVVF